MYICNENNVLPRLCHQNFAKELHYVCFCMHEIKTTFHKQKVFNCSNVVVGRAIRTEAQQYQTVGLSEDGLHLQLQTQRYYKTVRDVKFKVRSFSQLGQQQCSEHATALSSESFVRGTKSVSTVLNYNRHSLQLVFFNFQTLTYFLLHFNANNN